MKYIVARYINEMYRICRIDIPHDYSLPDIRIWEGDDYWEAWKIREAANNNIRDERRATIFTARNKRTAEKAKIKIDRAHAEALEFNERYDLITGRK